MLWGWYSLVALLFCQNLILAAKVTSAHMVRSYRNVPKAATSASECVGICHLCRAGQPDFDFENVCLDGTVKSFDVRFAFKACFVAI